MPTDPAILPERLAGPGDLRLRRWMPDDAVALAEAVAESADHLRPWMPWVSQEPLPIQARRARIDEWGREWASGGDVVLGVFIAGRIAGGGGLHRRIGPGGLEIGYWIHPRFLRQGRATAAAGTLTDAALSVPGIVAVEIHHDKANRASAGVPRKLGFELVEEVSVQPTAPADTGIEWRWRIDPVRWEARRRLWSTP